MFQKLQFTIAITVLRCYDSENSQLHKAERFPHSQEIIYLLTRNMSLHLMPVCIYVMLSDMEIQRDLNISVVPWPPKSSP